MQNKIPVFQIDSIYITFYFLCSFSKILYFLYEKSINIPDFVHIADCGAISTWFIKNVLKLKWYLIGAFEYIFSCLYHL